jgi:hypothetical protein
MVIPAKRIPDTVQVWQKDLPDYMLFRAKDFRAWSMAYEKTEFKCWLTAWKELPVATQRDIMVKIRYELRRGLHTLDGLLTHSLKVE